MSPYADDDRTQKALKLWIILSRAHAAIHEMASSDVDRHQLTAGEFGVLEALYHKGPMLLGEVQRKLLVSSGGITYLVDRLEAQGLVERRPCASDRRARYAALTDRGNDFMQTAFPTHAATIRQAVAELDDDEIQLMTDLLRRLGRHAADLQHAVAEPVG